MAAYRRFYDSRHLQADCQEPGSAPEPYALLLSMGFVYFFYYYYPATLDEACKSRVVTSVEECLGRGLSIVEVILIIQGAWQGSFPVRKRTGTLRI